MDTVTLLFTVIILGLLVERHLERKAARDDRDAFLNDLQLERDKNAAERAALIDQATDERRELLTRLQHPRLIVTKAEPVDMATPTRIHEDDNEYATVGVVQPTIEPDEAPESEPES